MYADQPASDSGGEARTPSFLTPQTIVTFPGATLAIAAVDKLVDKLAPTIANSPWPIVVIGGLVGAFIIWMSMTDPNVTLQPRDRKILIFVGIFNTAFLIASALGIQIIASGEP